MLTDKLTPKKINWGGKMCIRTDFLKKPVSDYIENKEVRFVEIKEIGRDDPLRQE